MITVSQRLAVGAGLGFILALIVLMGCLLIAAGGGRGVDRPFFASFPYAGLWVVRHGGIDAMTGVASLAQGVIYGIALAAASIKSRAWLLVAALAVGHVYAAITCLRLCPSISMYC